MRIRGQVPVTHAIMAVKLDEVYNELARQSAVSEQAHIGGADLRRELYIARDACDKAMKMLLTIEAGGGQ